MPAVPAAPLADVPEGGALAVVVDGVEIALVRDGDTVYAIADECSHAAIPLSEGEVEGCEIECWLHGSRFDLRTGKPVNLPATEPVQTYPTTIEGEQVLVDLSPAQELNA
ncbi:non-heme iron oxygenase ferredoxin subunit [Aeromicrobium terrae]|uniref:Non-heme iron oxygenase ferredoxin subunit n=1 Tax=Aeromicrobium terrae TaxID=2498846 RepID=A0A5C8NRR5_9ACTN|nr:non-heme iron oxygenase ferredoxin subunit [Aeromicrobium terrae]TXL63143.1 non-heme iron oxygenase ferredoxin subunit [Aeromicrobium terrae]